MSVGKTRRVQAITTPIRHARHSYENTSGDVESVDTTNNVLIKDENDFSGSKKNRDNCKEENEKEFVSDAALVSNAINIQAQASNSEKNSKKAIEAYEEKTHQDDDFDEFV